MQRAPFNPLLITLWYVCEIIHHGINTFFSGILHMQ